MPENLFSLISRYFSNINLKYVHKYSWKANIKKNFKIFLIECNTTERPKLGVSGVEDTAKTNKYLDMWCYIQIE